MYHPPFTFTGVNLFGPLTVKWGRRTAKRWGCLFTCLTTRADLEVTPSLKTLSWFFDNSYVEEDRLRKFGLTEAPIL